MDFMEVEVMDPLKNSGSLSEVELLCEIPNDDEEGDTDLEAEVRASTHFFCQ